ncbi:hypothetical protein [Candidatus Pelagibacter sp.]|uniref:hypothetical protein n=1 Tax=Candidatus Pelagibacter sp. TaxID=2024849 RepID=UPI003F878C1E
MKKINFFLTLLILIQGCGFTPVYISSDSVNFNIENVTYEGDQEINNYIKIGLKKYNAKNSDKANFKISAKTNYTKIAQSKDTKGNTQTFKVQSTVAFLVINNNQSFELIYSEQSEMNNSDDTFELKSLENTIKQNFASSMVDKLILDLSSR